MADLAIRVEGLGKEYILGQLNPYRTIRETVAELPRKILRKDGPSATGRDRMWALRDLDFELCTGEALGVIGHNGAGKSTLLKLLSRVTSPTEGRAEVIGRVSALLEVGTGFHPELTGRENVFLNGSVLGMSKAEISSRFDDIVEFAGVAQQIDTPIKRYSSGMQVRLAFAVAAHLEPEVLIVDEVLAVGDTAFQRKCLGSLERTAGSGRTVLFVSHNLSAVRSLCKRAIVLEGGRKVFEGPAGEAVEYYLKRRASDVADADSLADLPRLQSYRIDGSLRFTGIALTAASDGVESDEDEDVVIKVGEELRARVTFTVDRPLEDVILRFNIYTLDDVLVGQAGSANVVAPFSFQPGRHEVEVVLPSISVQPGRYAVGLSASDAQNPLDVVHPVAYFDVLEPLGLLPHYASRGGYLRLPARWGQPVQLGSGEAVSKSQ